MLPSDIALKTARLQLAVALAEKERLIKQYSEMHPAARRLADEVERLSKTVSVLEEQNAEQKRQELDQTRKRIAAIEASIPGWKEKVLESNLRLSDSQRLRNDLQRQQSRYDLLVSMLQTVDVNKNTQQERVTVLDPPSLGLPTPRSLPFRVFLAVAGGLFLSLGIVFAWHLLDDRFVSVRDVKDQFGEMVLGLVPQIKVARSKPEAALIEADDPRQAYVESYRHLRSALLLSPLGESRTQTLLFTGAGPNEGKTTIAINLARVLARSGLRVALVDADLRGGGLHSLLGAQEQPGVLDFLRGEAKVAAVVHETDLPLLTLVPVGSHSEQLEGLFLNARLGQLLEKLRAGRDFVIVDGAPILSADDAALLAPHADTVVVVVRPFYTRSRLVRQALDMLYQRQAKQVAIILNRARKDDLAGYHYTRNGAAAPSRNAA
jgi:capsular exopolysaccharide synthesis family protein